MNQRVAVAVVYVLALFVSVLDVTIVNVALPQIGRDLGVGSAALGGVSTGYLVALAVVTPASGWLGDRFGGKPVLLGAVALFTLASALCGLAQDLPQLVAARVVQGMGGGLLAPVGLAMLYRVYPPAQRVRALATTAVVTGLAPVLGPLVGGLLVSGLSWRWVFFVNLPIGVAAVAFGLVALRRQDVEQPGRLDLPGLVLSAGGLGGLLYAVGAGPQQGWGSLQVLLAGAGGVVLLVTLVLVQLRTAQPLLRLRLLAQPLFRAVNVVILLGNAAFFGALFVIALLLQDGLGLSARAAGACMLAEAVTVALGAQLASRVLYPRWGPRRLLVTGLGGVAAACAPMALVDDRGHLVGELVLLAVLGLSWSQVFIPATATAFMQVAAADTAQASTLFSATRQVGSALGVAVLSTVVALVAPGVGDGPAAVGQAASERLGAYHVALLVAAVLALAAAASALAVRDADARTQP